MKLQHIIIGVLLTGIVITSFVTFFNELSVDYNTTADFNEYNETGERLELIANQTKSMQQNITNIKIDDVTDIFTVPYNLLSAAWSFSKITMNNLVLAENVMSETTGSLESRGISAGGTSIKTYIWAIVSVLVVSMFIFAAFKWKFED